MDNEFFATSVDLGIVNVHLISGEDIIGHTFFNTVDKLYTIERPLIPNIAMDQQSGRFQVGLLPLRPYLDGTDKVVIPDSHVIYHIPVGDQMGSLYRRQTSNLVTATPGELNKILGQ